jgi:hypothetical protein
MVEQPAWSDELGLGRADPRGQVPVRAVNTITSR